MANASIRLSQARLLAIVSTVGLMVGSVSPIYAQDIPTPTPPADGGEFEGAPDPTPDPELAPEPIDIVPEPVEPVTPTDNVPGAVVPTSTELPADSSVPGTSEDLNNTPEVTLEEPSDNPASTELPVETTPELPTDATVEDSTIETESVTNAPGTPSNGRSPANNSPRGLW